ncbi:MAG: NAD(P)H-hydrate epimerase [Candidatus Saelkia tenebricola]|nr:NAD(P)H-hydrate epimerase [Candidatus Saelkia tenebricola]
MKTNSLSQKKAEILDRNLIYNIGIPRIALMENAGRRVADCIIEHTKKDDQIIIIAGQGYNGGDGLVAGRHLHVEGRCVRVFFIGRKEKAKDETISQLRILERLGVKVQEITKSKDIKKITKHVSQARFLIDALLGVGLRGEVRPLAHEIIKYINSSGGKIVSVDIPSGLDVDKGIPLPVAVSADYTVTFQAPKKGMLTSSGKKFSGEVIVANIGG